MAKNLAKTARRQLGGRNLLFIWRIFAELDKPKRTLSKINLTSMQVSIAVFLLGTVFKLGIILNE